MKIYIIANDIFDFENEKIKIGGVETYVWNLVYLLKENNYTPIIIQAGQNNFEKNINNINIIEIKSLSQKLLVKKIYLKKYLEKVLKPGDSIIFSTETLNFKIKLKRTIGIQHGIYWDMDKKPIFKSQFIEEIVNGIRSLYIRNRIAKTNFTVCVDYNFINWYRTQKAENKNNFRIIPNFTSTNIEVKKIFEANIVKIIFARRFEIYRGTRIFANAVEQLIREFKNIEIIFAGDGTDSEYLKNKFKDEKNVKFIKYEYKDSLKVHMDKDIAVIPTTGSEGTSLSALEAMASECAVISSNVGGLSNIIIDQFNGLLINPVEEELFEALKLLITNVELRKKLASNGAITVENAFNKKNWDSKWLKVIKEIELL